MKTRITKTEAKQNWRVVLSAGNQLTNYVLKHPSHYITRGSLGWACDCFDLGHGILITSGYDTVGKPLPYQWCHSWEKKMEKASDLPAPISQNETIESRIKRSDRAVKIVYGNFKKAVYRIAAKEVAKSKPRRTR